MAATDKVQRCPQKGCEFKAKGTPAVCPVCKHPIPKKKAEKA